MARVKETEFFNTNFHKGTDWYEAHFSHLSGEKAVGEVSNNYYLDPAVALKIRRYDPSIKLMLNVRDPTELLWSFYRFGRRRGLELPPLEMALEEPIGRIMGSGFDSRSKQQVLTVADQVTLLDSVRLYDWFLPFVETFPRDQIYFFVYERIRSQPEQVLENIFRFLGVDPGFRPPKAMDVVNASIEPRSRTLARASSKLAFLLRRAGAYKTLARLHRFELVKSLFFRPVESRERLPRSEVMQSSRELAAELEFESKRIISLVPEFAELRQTS